MCSTTFYFFYYVLGRSGYDELSDHWQFLNHQTFQNDSNGNDVEPKYGSSSSRININENVNRSTNSLNSTVYKVFGYKYSFRRSCFFNMFAFLLLGIPYLIINWFPGFVILKHKKCSLKFCDFVIGKC